MNPGTGKEKGRGKREKENLYFRFENSFKGRLLYLCCINYHWQGILESK